MLPVIRILQCNQVNIHVILTIFAICKGAVPWVFDVDTVKHFVAPTVKYSHVEFEDTFTVCAKTVIYFVSIWSERAGKINRQFIYYFKFFVNGIEAAKSIFRN